MTSKPNRNVTRRDTIIFGEGTKQEYIGGIEPFSALTAEKAQQLINENFMDENEAQNNAPTIVEFLAFIKEYPVFGLDGYAVAEYRPDYRVAIEGISKIKGKHLTDKDKQALKQFANYADEVDIDKGFAWYD